MSRIAKVVLVQRLREVTSLVAFTRFEAAAADVEGEFGSGDSRDARLLRNVVSDCREPGGGPLHPVLVAQQLTPGAERKR